MISWYKLTYDQVELPPQGNWLVNITPIHNILCATENNILFWTRILFVCLLSSECRKIPSLEFLNIFQKAFVHRLRVLGVPTDLLDVKQLQDWWFGESHPWFPNIKYESELCTCIPRQCPHVTGWAYLSPPGTQSHGLPTAAFSGSLSPLIWL